MGFKAGFGLGLELQRQAQTQNRAGLSGVETGFGADESCAGLSDCGLDSAGPLGSFTSAGASLVGIRSRGASEDTHMPCRLRIRVLPVYSLIPAMPARNERRLVQWFSADS